MITIEVDAAVTKDSGPSTPDSYSLTFSQDRIVRRLGEQPTLRREETFGFERKGKPRQSIAVSGGTVVLRAGKDQRSTGLREGSLGLSSIPRLGPESGSIHVDELASLFADFRVFDIDVAAARRPSPQGYSRTLAQDAGNLAAFLAYMHEEHTERSRPWPPMPGCSYQGWRRWSSPRSVVPRPGWC